MYFEGRRSTHDVFYDATFLMVLFFYEGNSPVLSMTCGVTSALAARVSSIKLHKKVSRKEAYYSPVIP